MLRKPMVAACVGIGYSAPLNPPPPQIFRFSFTHLGQEIGIKREKQNEIFEKRFEKICRLIILLYVCM